MKLDKPKFEFSTDFQFEILKYIIQDREGFTLLMKIKPHYLVLIEHALILEGILKYFKKYKKVPSENILKEVIQELLKSKSYVDLVVKEDLPNIFKLIKVLYSAPLKDPDYIKEKVFQFSMYVEVKKLTESLDLKDFDSYLDYAQKVERVIKESKPKAEDQPIYLIKGITDRQFKRQANPAVVPCPFRQLNELTNAGGYPIHSVNVILDKPKARKTFFLVNLAKGYLRMKKSVLYVDLENGQDQIMDRMVQSSINKSKAEVYTGEFDKLEVKHLRKLARFGVEFVVKRMPAMVTNCNDIRDLIRKLRQEGIDIRVLVVDYAGKLASINGDRDDFERISNSYIDLQNLAEEEDLDVVWSAHHITRQGAKHRSTRYQENDISGSISIVRNAQLILGLNATDQEDNDNIQRTEIVVQRDGLPSGRALFKIDVERQRLVEFTKEQRKQYEQIYGEKMDKEIKEKEAKEKLENHGDI